MSFYGSVANINAALNGLTFVPTQDFNGGATLTIASGDNTITSLDIDANLQARYTFAGNANDSGPGTQQNGTLTNGASIVTDGTRGQVLNLDGVNDYVDLNSSTSTFASYTQGTIAGWIKATGTFETIFSISDTADTGSYASLFLGASGYLTYEVYENGVAQLAVYRSSSAAINDETGTMWPLPLVRLECAYSSMASKPRQDNLRTMLEMRQHRSSLRMFPVWIRWPLVAIKIPREANGSSQDD